MNKKNLNKHNKIFLKLEKRAGFRTGFMSQQLRTFTILGGNEGLILRGNQGLV